MQLLTPPVGEPLDPETAKLWARIDGTAFDALMPMCITAARQVAEQELGSFLMTQTWRIELPGWPDPCMLVNLFPVQSIALSYWNGSAFVSLGAGAVAAVKQPDGFGFTVQRVAGSPGYPSGLVSASPGTSVYLDVTVGYGDDGSDVPQAIRMFIAAHCAFWARNPEAAQEAKFAMVPSPFLSGLLDPFRTWL